MAAWEKSASLSFQRLSPRIEANSGECGEGVLPLLGEEVIQRLEPLVETGGGKLVGAQRRRDEQERHQQEDELTHPESVIVLMPVSVIRHP